MLSKLKIVLFVILAYFSKIENISCFTDLHLIDVELYSKKDSSIKTLIHNYKKTEIKVVEQVSNSSSDLLIIFVHGAPGDHKAFRHYMNDPQLKKLAKMVSYDRPGYGKSSQIPMTNISDQADVLHSIVKSYNYPNVMIIGHSYGGPIVANALARYPDDIQKAIMIAPLNDPYSEPIFWFSHLARWKLTKWMLPHGMKRAGDEKFSHAKELEKMAHLWSVIKNPILHIHGVNDKLAPTDPNIKWSKTMIPTSVLRIEVVEDEGHLIIWQGFKKVRSLIKSMIE